MAQRSPIDLYTYVLAYTALDNGGTQTLPIQVTSESHFFWTHGVAYVREAVTGVPFAARQGAITGAGWDPSWPLTVSILDSGTDRQLQQAPVPLQALFGHGHGVQQALAHKRLFKKNSTISVTINRTSEGQVDAAGAATNLNLLVTLCFIGYKVFDDAALNNLTRR